MHHKCQVTVSQLACRRADRLLFEHIGFTLMTGQLLHIQGANGCGKSTLLRILAGLYEDYTGQILNSCPCLHYVGHRQGLHASLTVAENIGFQGLLTKQPRVDVGSVLKQLGLYGLRRRLASQLSSGQRQRLALAPLLMAHAPLWLLDEPFTALDSQGIGLLDSFIQAYLAEGGMVIITSHQALPRDYASMQCMDLEAAHA